MEMIAQHCESISDKTDSNVCALSFEFSNVELGLEFKMKQKDSQLIVLAKFWEAVRLFEISYTLNSSARTGGATELIFWSNALIFSILTEGHAKNSHFEPTLEGP